MEMYSQKIMKVLKALGTSLENGLSVKEAEKRKAEHGGNALAEHKRSGFFKKLMMQFNDAMVLLLAAAAAVSFAAALYNGGDMSEPIIIMTVVLFNGIIGVIQENKAEKALEALKKSGPKKARAVRGGVLTEINAEDIVPGDILHVSQGDIVPADCRICGCMGLMTSEANLTGESQPIEKTTETLAEGTPLAERKNMVYMGTNVLAGRGVCVVTATGMDTETGRIAGMLDSQELRETPLQKRLGEMGKVLGALSVVICAVIFFIGIFQKRPVLDMLMVSVSLAVAAIPEGLPAIVTVMLAAGVQAMARENAVVRRLSAVEALGSATVICTDKTGTLTKNKMTVSEVFGRDRERILKAAALCTNVESGEGGRMGDPTETAIVEAAGMSESVDLPRVDEISFTSERKMMTGIFADRGRFLAISKGAPEIMLEKCCYINDCDTALDSEGRRKLREKCGEMESRGLRVLAVAFRPLEKFSKKGRDVERDMCFLGVIGLLDEPRPEAAEAVKKCGEAGIRTVMITGDSPLTAKTIGERVGIESKTAATGSDIDGASDEELEKMLAEGCNIFARTSPEHKLKIVKALQKAGHIAAMTGDACNDAPALKAADIGCAMGMGGTETAREAADIVLTDDNFATIVKAVERGRGIYANIKKTVHFLLSSNIGEIITVFASMCFAFAVPLAPVHLLWINLVTDSLPAIALGLEPVEKDVMKGRPVVSKAMFGREGWVSIAAEGAMIGLLALIAGGIGNVIFRSEAAAVTMTFATLSISQLVHAFNMRSEHSVFTLDPFSNKWLILAFFAGCALQAGVICIPALNGLFAVTALSVEQWLCVAVLCLVPIAVAEFEKAVSRGK